MKIRVYQSEDLIEELDGSYLRDCYNREVRINSWRYVRRLHRRN